MRGASVGGLEMKGVVEVGNRNCRGIERASSLAAAVARLSAAKPGCYP